jgi:hypothetical protein
VTLDVLAEAAEHKRSAAPSQEVAVQRFQEKKRARAAVGFHPLNLNGAKEKLMQVAPLENYSSPTKRRTFPRMIKRW